MPIMTIEKVTRSYKRSFNLKSYGSQAESWITCEATYTGQCESTDDPLQVSQMLADQAQKDVAAQVNGIIEKIKGANPKTVPATVAPAATPTPVAPATNNVPPAAPQAAAPVAPVPSQPVNAAPRAL